MSSHRQKSAPCRDTGAGAQSIKVPGSGIPPECNTRFIQCFLNRGACFTFAASPFGAKSTALHKIAATDYLHVRHAPNHYAYWEGGLDFIGCTAPYSVSFSAAQPFPFLAANFSHRMAEVGSPMFHAAAPALAMQFVSPLFSAHLTKSA